MKLLRTALLSLALVGAAHADRCMLNVAPNPEVVLSGRQISNLTGGGKYDGPISTYRVGDDVFWIVPTSMRRNSKPYVQHAVLKGPRLSEATPVGVYNAATLLRNSPSATTGTKGYKWITATYQNEHGVLALVHSEFTGPHDYWGMPCGSSSAGNKVCAPGRSNIGLAWMETSPGFSGVPQFTFLGHIAGFSADTPHFNVQGTPYTVTRENGIEYLNIWFADRNRNERGLHIAWARSPLRDVIAAARRGRTSKWLKYRDGAWEDALVGRSSSALTQNLERPNIDRRVAAGDVIVHSGAVKDRETGRFFLSAYNMQTDRFPSSFAFYNSCDGVNWTLNSISNVRTARWPGLGWSYMSFIDDDGTDNGLASGSFSLLAGWFNGGLRHYIARFSVDVSESCSCPTRHSTRAQGAAPGD